MIYLIGAAVVLAAAAPALIVLVAIAATALNRWEKP